MSGTIHAFTNQQSTDNLATCLTSQDILLDGFKDAEATLMKRYNEDVVQGVAHLNSIYKSLGSYVEACSDKTKEQVKIVESKLAAVDEATILANLADHKNHIELTYAKMKMHAIMHDFPEWGMSLADFYTTVTK